MDKKPVVIYSSCLQNNYQGVLEQKDYAIYSNYLAQRAGYETILYTDTESKALLGDIPYNKIIDFDENILNKLPKTVWAAGKILAFSMQTSPFIHLDFDFFMLKNDFYEKVKDKHFFLFHEEPWLQFSGNFYPHGIQKILKITNNDFGVNLNEKSISLNFSIFGSCQKNVIPIIAEKSNLIIKTLIKYKNQFENENFKQYLEKYFSGFSSAMPSIIIEQVILPNLISQTLDASYYPILQQLNIVKDVTARSKDVKLLHLWGFKKNKEIQSLIKKKLSDSHNNVT